MPNLRHLQILYKHYLTEAGLRKLGEMAQLKSLGLTGAFSDRGLRHLGGLVNLEELVLMHTPITGEGLAHFNQMKRLQTLHLGYCHSLTDVGLEHLTHLSSLTTLTLWDTKVSDAGIDSLARLGQLRNLDIKGTQISAEGFATLKMLLPKARIAWSVQPVAPPRADDL